MIATGPGGKLLTALRIAHAEWRPLLALIEEALWEVERPEWRDAVPSGPSPCAGSEPLLSGTVIGVPSSPIERWVRRVLVTAAGVGPEAHFVDAATARRIDPRSLLQAAVAQDEERLDGLARTMGDTHGVLAALAPLISMPLLHACRRAWAASGPATWPHGYCPTCGAWPTLAEIRGLDGGRHLRCRRCGADWVSEWLRCPFCGERDHAQLGSLVSAGRVERDKIEVCDRCHGYIKTTTTFAPISPEQVVLQDLATVVLDVAAVERGYRPPRSRGPVAVRIVAGRSSLRAVLSRAFEVRVV
jgi:FdhE protein